MKINSIIQCVNIKTLVLEEVLLVIKFIRRLIQKGLDVPMKLKNKVAAYLLVIYWILKYFIDINNDLIYYFSLLVSTTLFVCVQLIIYDPEKLELYSSEDRKNLGSMTLEPLLVKLNFSSKIILELVLILLCTFLEYNSWLPDAYGLLFLLGLLKVLISLAIYFLFASIIIDGRLET